MKKIFFGPLTIALFLLNFGCGGGSSVSYPIDSNVQSTLTRTISPGSTPTTEIDLYDLSKYDQYGYGSWTFGAALARDKRLDIMPTDYVEPATNTPQRLLNFFSISDIHITDKEAPNQLIYLQRLYPKVAFGASVFSGVMLYTTHVLDAAIQTVNALHKQSAFDFGIALGDAINSTQYNELRWYIDVIDGKVITPSSGANLGAAIVEYQKPFKAAGLDKTIPWYQTLGNHDHFFIGSIPVDHSLRADLRESYVSGDIFDAGDVLGNPVNINRHDYYMGVVNGASPYGEIVGAGPVAEFKEAPEVTQDPNRRSLLRTEFMREFFNTTSTPVGHGFDLVDPDQEAGFACYSFVPKSDVPLKVIVLDDTQIETDGSNDIHGHGFLDQARWSWLKNELADGDANGQLMIIAAHVPINVELTADNSELGWWTDHQNAVTLPDLVSELQGHPNLLMWISGHRHLNTVKAFISPDPVGHPELGFWEVETSSLRDFPQQFRTFEIVRNSDNTISILITNVDPAVKEGAPAAISRKYAIGALQIIGVDAQSVFDHNPTNDPTIKPMPTGSYNAELVKQLTPAMQSILAR